MKRRTRPPRPANDKPMRPSVRGLTADSDALDLAGLWQSALTVQANVLRASQRRADQRIEIPDPDAPFALAMLSDLHFGNPGTDYAQAGRDAEIVRDTPRMFAIYHGDGIDNWIHLKLQHLQRGQALAYDAEIQLFEAWLRPLTDKLVASVSGNHENWSSVLAGFDRIRDCLRGTQSLYDPHEVVFDLAWGKRVWKVKVRHRYRYSSIFNMTHGIEVNWERGGVPFDIGIGGHTHLGTVCRPFYRQEQRRYAILTGTYKLHDDYGRQLGTGACVDRGCGALVFSESGLFWTENLELAADFLRFLIRGNGKATGHGGGR